MMRTDEDRLYNQMFLSVLEIKKITENIVDYIVNINGLFVPKYAFKIPGIIYRFQDNPNNKIIAKECITEIMDITDKEIKNPSVGLEFFKKIDGILAHFKIHECIKSIEKHQGMKI